MRKLLALLLIVPLLVSPLGAGDNKPEIKGQLLKIDKVYDANHILLVPIRPVDLQARQVFKPDMTGYNLKEGEIVKCDAYSRKLDGDIKVDEFFGAISIFTLSCKGGELVLEVYQINFPK